MFSFGYHKLILTISGFLLVSLIVNFSGSALSVGVLLPWLFASALCGFCICSGSALCICFGFCGSVCGSASVGGSSVGVSRPAWGSVVSAWCLWGGSVSALLLWGSALLLPWLCGGSVSALSVGAVADTDRSPRSFRLPTRQANRLLPPADQGPTPRMRNLHFIYSGDPYKGAENALYICSEPL